MRLFGTDGVRGIPEEDLTEELAFNLGRSAANLLKKQGNAKIVIGRDTRQSGDALERAIVNGICTSGADAIGVEVIPTPAISYLTQKLSCCGGAVISASHNPYEYNGIKFFDSNGVKLSEKQEDEIERNLSFNIKRPTGSFSIDYKAHKLYLEHLLKSIDSDFNGLKVCLDCANGSAYKIAPEVFNRLGADTLSLSCKPDGKNINDSCGSTYPEYLEEVISNNNETIGFAFDGDGDRVIAVDEKGAHVDGDFIMAICALDMKERGVLNNNTVVTTVMTNLGFHLAMKKNGIKVIQTAVGDKYVLDKMRETGANLGGEQSGHIIFSDHGLSGDGILTGLKILDIIKRKEKALSELKHVMERLPQVLLNVKVNDKRKLKKADSVWHKVRQAEADLKGRGRILVRPSGTESLVRVMIESDDHDHALETANEVAEIVKKELA